MSGPTWLAIREAAPKSMVLLFLSKLKASSLASSFAVREARAVTCEAVQGDAWLVWRKLLGKRKA